MTKRNTRRGFTLIELLVVVLIIGILAAVALPQYKIAVTKSKYMKLVSVMSSLKTAEELYYLANGHYVDDVTVLDIGNVDGCEIKGTDTIGCTDFGIDIHGAISFNNPWGVLHESGLRYIPYFDHSNVNPGLRECWSVSNDAFANKVCKSLGGTENGTRTWGDTEYNRYLLP